MRTIGQRGKLARRIAAAVSAALAILMIQWARPTICGAEHRDAWGDLRRDGKDGSLPSSASASPPPIPATPTPFAPVDLFEETEHSPGIEPIVTPNPASIPRDTGLMARVKDFFSRLLEDPEDTLSETAQDAVDAAATPVAQAGEKIGELSDDAKRAVTGRDTDDIQDTRRVPEDAYDPPQGKRGTAGDMGRAIEEQVQDAENAVRGLFQGK